MLKSTSTSAITTTTMTSDQTARWGPKHKGAQELASMYSRGKRVQEMICLTLGTCLMTWNLGALLWRIQMADWVTILIYAALGIVAADFASGFVHWAADTWGSVDTALGKAFIRPFREHHVDPTAITRHDFVEVNADNFMLVVPAMGAVAWQHCSLTEEDLRAVYLGHWFWLLLAFYVGMTNQIHKWSHTYLGLPKSVKVLQSLHLILPRAHHKLHHVSPHACNYCITTGWCNPFLEAMSFWPRLEALITHFTGAVPRSDDMAWAKTTTSHSISKLDPVSPSLSQNS